MKFIFLFLLFFSLLVSCKQAVRGNDTINNQIGQYIQQNCEENTPCQVEIKNAIDFSWDKLYVFSESVEDHEISEILNINYSSCCYSRKWIFLKDNQIVRSEEHVLYEVDVPVLSGDVLLTKDDSNGMSRFFERNAMFKVEKNKLDDKEYYYYLKCTNCFSN